MDTQLTMQLKVMGCKKAVIAAWDKMPQRFSALTLCLETRRIMSKMTMDGTILRRLRELRESGRCVYKVVDPVNSIYEKIDQC